MLKQSLSQDPHWLVDDPVQRGVCPLCRLLTALWVTLPAALHQGPAREAHEQAVSSQSTADIPSLWMGAQHDAELLEYLREGQQLTNAMVLETYPSPRSPNSAWVSWNISTFLWKLETKRFHGGFTRLKITTDVSWNINSLVEKICQSSETAACHSRPQELVDGCRSVQVHFEPLQLSTSVGKDRVRHWKVQVQVLCSKIYANDCKNIEIKMTQWCTWMTERARWDWYSSTCRVWAHLLSSSSRSWISSTVTFSFKTITH